MNMASTKCIEDFLQEFCPEGYAFFTMENGGKRPPQTTKSHHQDLYI